MSIERPSREHQEQAEYHEPDPTPKADLCSEIPCAEYRDKLECRVQSLEAVLREATSEAKLHELRRWETALKEFGFNPHPGLSVKENLALFGDWWARQKAAGN